MATHPGSMLSFCVLFYDSARVREIQSADPPGMEADTTV